MLTAEDDICKELVGNRMAATLSFGSPCDIGPGMGVGVIGVVLGILVAIFLAFFAILWYPVKRLFVRRRNQKEEKPGDSEDNKQDSN